MFSDLNDRARAILKQVVDVYLETGEPVGSRRIADAMGQSLSPASIRAVMAELEERGLLLAPHVSAGRVPTEAGMRLFVDGILEVGDLADEDRKSIEAECAATGLNMAEVLARATGKLAGLSSCAGLVLAPKTDRPLKRIEFVALSPERVLVVLVTGDGVVENRVIEAPPETDAVTLAAAADYLNRRLEGRRLDEVRRTVEAEIAQQRAELDGLTARLVEGGLAVWAGAESVAPQLLVRGQAHLLEDVTALADLERVRSLFETLEAEETIVRLIDAAHGAEGVRVFIGAENGLFAHAGCSLIVAPYRGGQAQVVGAIGVIGPVRMNYARIVPMVDFTARVLGRVMGGTSNYAGNK